MVEAGGSEEMNTKHFKSWLKHFDFILIDIMCLQISFVIACWVTAGCGNPYRIPRYQFTAVILLTSQLLVIVFNNKYGGILRRKRFDEFVSVVKYIIEVMVVALVYLFAVKNSASVSRLQLGISSILFVILSYLLRQLNKRRVLHQKTSRKNLKSIVLVTGKDYVEEAIQKLYAPGTYHDYYVSWII
ncbi:MAG TPA: hypothetical protein DCM49_02370, partial [Lachnospiraceae bacterium]|nr:hypothetical protein [Lachnospiraceae bacterium]